MAKPNAGVKKMSWDDLEDEYINLKNELLKEKTKLANANESNTK